MKGLFVIALCCLGSALFAQEQPWRLMEKARLEFQNREYAAALTLANRAKENRKQEYAQYIALLQNEIRSPQVRSAGDSLTAVTKVLAERDSLAALEIINAFTDRYGPDFYRDSLKALLDHLGSMGTLPEAEILIGDVYLVEGELGLAKAYYEGAWKNAHALDIPDSKYDILYKLAHLADLSADEELYEQSLLLVLDSDPYARGFQDMNGAFIRTITRAASTNYNRDRFFDRYRATTYRALKAYLYLARFYRAKGDTDKYFAMAALGAVTAFTRIDTILNDRELEYSYQGFDRFWSSAMANEEIRDWITDNEVDALFALFEYGTAKLP